MSDAAETCHHPDNHEYPAALAALIAAHDGMLYEPLQHIEAGLPPTLIHVSGAEARFTSSSSPLPWYPRPPARSAESVITCWRP